MTDIKGKCEELAGIIRSYADEVEEQDGDGFYKAAAILRAVPDLVKALEHCTCPFVSVEDGNKVGMKALSAIRKAIGEDND